MSAEIPGQVGRPPAVRTLWDKVALQMRAAAGLVPGSEEEQALLKARRLQQDLLGHSNGSHPAAGEGVSEDGSPGISDGDGAPGPGVDEVARIASEGAKRWLDTGVKALQMAAAGGLPQYAQDYITIRDKSGQLRPFLFNRAQMVVHEMAERQIAERGYVRLIVLKGRQMGLSTYILCRGFFKATRRSGYKAYILTHELKATTNLFGIVKGYYERIDARLRPSMGRSNTNEMQFPGLGSGYTVGTARVGDTGRSITAQFFHGSECGFWQAAKDIMAGLMQAIGRVEGTEVWLESTANGAGNFFHSAVQQARKKTTDFELAFIPWFWDPGYTTPTARIPKEFAELLNLDDLEYMRAHGLSLEQMHWRAQKIGEFTISEHSDEGARLKFQQEYPATVEEAFLADAEGAFIKSLPVVLARKAYREALAATGARPVGIGPKRIGIDPSYTGGDGFRVWVRQGRVAYRADHWEKKRTQESISRLLAVFEREQPDEIYIDIGNNGGPIYDLLCESVWGGRIVPVLFGEAADDPERHQNKRCEMWFRTRDWLIQKPQVYLEDIEEIQADLTAVLTRRDDVGNRTKLESKDDMRKRLGPNSSPDDGDALALTFAYPSGGPAGGKSSGAPDPRRPSYHGPGMGR